MFLSDWVLGSRIPLKAVVSRECLLAKPPEAPKFMVDPYRTEGF